MKTLHKLKCLLLFAGLVVAGSQTNAQEEAKPEVLVTYRYFAKNNNFQYLLVQTKIKADNKIQPMPGVVLKLFLDESVPQNLISKVRTNEKGEAKAVLPVALKTLWDASATHKFLAVVEATSAEEETTTELEITKAKIVLDTVNDEGTRKVTAQVLAFENGEWIPAKEVELKMGVSRLGGVIKIGEEESYTTDSLGYAEGEFLVDSLPAADKKGNIVLVAKIEDNELYGNLSMEKTVPWGAYFTRKSNFNERSLWATRNKTPLWLLFMAYSIMVGVWAVIIYLVFGLIKIKRLGKHEAVRVKEPVSAKGVMID
jgi:hypothetical protein